MRMLYVTYQQSGVLKKGAISEVYYNHLKSESTVSNLVMYPNEMIMENNYSVLTAEGTKGSGKNILHG